MGRAIRIIGTLLALSCIGYLLVRQAPNLPPLDVTSPGLWAALVLALVCYVLSQLAAAEAWRSILSLWGVILDPRLARGQPMVSQIGKYIPGNVAHLFGRLVIGRRDGVGGGTLAASMALEVAITLGVGLALAGLLLLAVPDVLPNLTAHFPDLASRMMFFSVAVMLAIGIGIGAIMLRARLDKLGMQRPSLPELSKPLACHLVSFAVLGLSLWATAIAVAPPGMAPELITCTLVFAVAWAAGFVVPGAPGGIGVRDSIIVLGLAISVGEGTGLAIALLHRVISVLGDVTTFGIGWQMRRGQAQQYPRNRPEPAAFVAD